MSAPDMSETPGLSPYYESPCKRAVLYQGDALDVLASLDEASIDAIVTDPPYCSGGATETGRSSAAGQGLRSDTLRNGRFSWFDTDNMTTPGLMWLLRSVGLEGARVIRGGGSLCVFTDWRMVPSVAPSIESSGFRYQNLVIWDKGSMGLGRGFRMQHEVCLHFTSGTGVYYDRAVGNVITTPRPSKSDRHHPTEKPVDLLAPIVRVVAPPDGTIVDPFMGSGSTAVAALREGRRFIGVERSAEYIDTAGRRIDAALAQGSLFTPQAPAGVSR